MKNFALGGVLILTLALPALAQEAPVPHKAPRTPVNRQTLPSRQPIQSRDIQGVPLIIDGEKLRVEDVDLRLFGVVPPQLSASYGPQARSALDSLVAGQPIACHIRDRDHDGRLLATCRTSNGNDLALELLRRGLAVTARGSLADTEYAESYLGTEQAAQNQHIGLWSVTMPAAAPVTAAPAPVPVPAPVVVTMAPPPVPAAATVVTPSAAALVASAIPAPKPEVPIVVELKKEEKNTKAAPAEKISAPKAPPLIAAAPVREEIIRIETGFVARYQPLVASLIILMAALGVVGAMFYQRYREKRAELQSLAAALRGELLAARAVCQTRLKTIVTDEDDKTMVWPRIRATLYQAYVGRLGLLGAELSRQVASIYGQSSDYAAYYKTEDEKAALTPKRQALQTLITHIEEVLPKLAAVEQARSWQWPSGPWQRPKIFPPSPPRSPVMLPEAVRRASEKLVPEKTMSEKLAAEKLMSEKTMGETWTAEKSAPEQPVAMAMMAKTITSETTPAPAATPAPQASIKPYLSAAMKPAVMWDSLRKFVHEHFAPNPATNANDEAMTDYAALIEQEIASMSFTEAEDEISDPKRGIGS